MKKRILSLAMALVMCLSLLPTSAFATKELINMAKDATVLDVSHGSPNDKETASHAFDGNREGTKWCVVNDRGWVTFQLNAPVQPAAMMVYHAGQGAAETTRENTSDYQLEVLDTSKISEADFLASAERASISANDSYWKPVSSVKDNTEDVSQSHVTMTDAASVFRFRVQDAGNDNVIRIYEIELIQEYILPDQLLMNAMVLTTGQKESIITKFDPSYAHVDLTYKAEDETIAKVEGNTVTALKEGVTTLTATSPEVPDLIASMHIAVVPDTDVHELAGYQPVWTESFESGALPEGWTTEDRDNDGHDWEITKRADSIHHGVYGLASASWKDEALTPDNWLVTPELEIGDQYWFSFACSELGAKPLNENVGVYVLEQGEPPVQLGEYRIAGDWENIYTDLSAYAGKTVRLALVHHNTEGQYSLLADCFCLWAPLGPDYTEADVTFKVVNGSWSDGTSGDQIVTVPMVSGAGTLFPIQIPNMRPAAGFKGGAWDVSPDMEPNGITGSVTYTYTFQKSSDPAALTIGSTTLTDLSVDQKGEHWEWDAAEQQLLFDKGYNLGQIQAVNIPELSLSAHMTLDPQDCWDSQALGSEIVLNESRFVNVDLHMENCRLAEGAAAPTRAFYGIGPENWIRYCFPMTPDEDMTIVGSIVDSDGVNDFLCLFPAPCSTFDLDTWYSEAQFEDDITLVVRGHHTVGAMLDQAQPVTLPAEISQNLTEKDITIVDGSFLGKGYRLPTMQEGDVLRVDLSAATSDIVGSASVEILRLENGEISDYIYPEIYSSGSWVYEFSQTGEYVLMLTCGFDYSYDQLLDSNVVIDLSLNQSTQNDCLILNKDTASCTGDKWTWDQESSTLTLKDGFQFNSLNDSGILCEEGDFTIVVEGKADIAAYAEGIMVRNGNLTILLKAGSELSIVSSENAIDSLLTDYSPNDPNSDSGKSSVRILGEQSSGKRPLLRCYAGEDCIHANLDISITDCELKLSADSKALNTRSDFYDPRQTVALKNCLTDIFSNSDDGIRASCDITIDGGQLRILSDRTALRTEGSVVFLNDPILDVRAPFSIVVMTGSSDFTIPGEFQLLDDDHNVIYEGTWDEGVKSGSILLRNKNAMHSDVDPAYVIGVELEDGSTSYAAAILSKRQELPVENPFTDVKEGDWFYAPVLWAVENGITSGLTKTEFGTFAECNRAQIVTFLWSAAGKPAPTLQDNPFTDVPENEWFHDAVLWAVENGITSGMTETEFGPTATCNRAQAVTFLWKYMKQPAASAELQFTDVQEGAWYEKPVQWAVENGVTSGLSDTLFGTTADCLRAQIVTFIYRALNK